MASAEREFGVCRQDKSGRACSSARISESFSAPAPAHPLLTLQQQAGNQAVQGLLRSGLIQAKLAVSNPGDPDEREADQVADSIMRMPGGAPISSPCSCSGGEEMCAECQQKQGAAVARKASGVLQRQQTGPQTNVPTSPQTTPQTTPQANPQQSQRTWTPDAISSGLQRTVPPLCYGDSGGYSGLASTGKTVSGKTFSSYCGALCAHRPLPLSVWFFVDTDLGPRPGVKAGDKVSSVSASVKFTPSSGGPDRIVLQGQGDGTYDAPSHPLKTTFSTSLSFYTPVEAGKLVVSLINSDRAGQGLGIYSDQIEVQDCPLPAARHEIGYLEVPDPDNAPLQYQVVGPNTPVPGRGVLVPAEKDDKGYFYLYKERRVDLPGDPIPHGPQPPDQNPGTQTQSGQSSAVQSQASPVPRKAADNSSSEGASASHAGAALSLLHHESGEPLDAGTRSFFEPRFGRDFSQVRVHAAGQAAESAQSIQAMAYTAGNHIVFGSQQYQPSSEQGRHLLAHELTHVVQQGGGSAPSMNSGSLHRKVAVDQAKFTGATAATDRTAFEKMIVDELKVVTGMNLAFASDVLTMSGQPSGGSVTARQVLSIALNDQGTVWFDPSPKLGAQEIPGRGIEIGTAQPTVRLTALRPGIVIIHELAHHYPAQLKPAGYDAKMQQLLKDANAGKQLTPAESEQLLWYRQASPSADENIAVATENKVQQELGLIKRTHYAIQVEFPPKPGATGPDAWSTYSVFQTNSQPPKFLYLDTTSYDLYSSQVDYFAELVKAGHPAKPAPGAMIKIVPGTAEYQAVRQHLL